MTENAESRQVGWFQQATSGTPFLAFMAAVVAIVWTIAQGYFGPAAKLGLIEQRLTDITKGFERMASHIENLRDTDSKIEIMQFQVEARKDQSERHGREIDDLRQKIQSIMQELGRSK